MGSKKTEDGTIFVGNKAADAAKAAASKTIYGTKYVSAKAAEAARVAAPKVAHTAKVAASKTAQAAEYLNENTSKEAKKIAGISAVAGLAMISIGLLIPQVGILKVFVAGVSFALCIATYLLIKKAD